VSEGALLRSAVLAQTRAELLLTMRRGENVLITMVVPVLLLIFFASLGIVRAGTARPVDFLLPGMLSLAVIATGMVSLGIATAYERYYGVLKRLGASPLPRAGLIAAKALSVLVLEVLQVALLVVIAAAVYGWRPPHSAAGLATAALALLLGTAAFAGLGLAMATGPLDVLGLFGSARAEAATATAAAQRAPGNGGYGPIKSAGPVLDLPDGFRYIRFGDEGFEGFLPVRRMRGDWWELNEEGTMLLGEKRGGVLRLGDPIRIKVDRVDSPRGRVDLVPAA